MSEYVVSLPVIGSASISPNPVDINAKYTLSIKVSEIEKILSRRFGIPVKSIQGRYNTLWQ